MTLANRVMETLQEDYCSIKKPNPSQATREGRGGVGVVVVMMVALWGESWMAGNRFFSLPKGILYARPAPIRLHCPFWCVWILSAAAQPSSPPHWPPVMWNSSMKLVLPRWDAKLHGPPRDQEEHPR